MGPWPLLGERLSPPSPSSVVRPTEERVGLFPSRSRPAPSKFHGSSYSRGYNQGGTTHPSNGGERMELTQRQRNILALAVAAVIMIGGSWLFGRM